MSDSTDKAMSPTLENAMLLAQVKDDPTATTIVSMLIEIRTSIDTMREQVEKIDSDLRATVPDGNFDGHRVYHENVMRREEDARKTIADAKRSTVTWGLRAFIAFLGYAIWEAFKRGIK